MASHFCLLKIFLQKRVEKISDILVIERKLTRVRSKVEQLQGQLNFPEL